MSPRRRREQEGVEQPDSSPTPVKDALIKSGLKSEIVPPSEPKPLENGYSRVNLKHVVILNGKQYGPGEDVDVPTDAFEVWRHALADGKE